MHFHTSCVSSEESDMTMHLRSLVLAFAADIYAISTKLS